jgi:HlyD family secretion protein
MTNPSARLSGEARDAKNQETATSPARASLKAAPARARSRSTWLIAGGALLFLAIGIGALFLMLRGPAEPSYATQPVTRGSVVRVVTASGTVNPVITVQVGTYVSGVIQARYCDYNTHVAKGQLCAKIDPRPYQVVVDKDLANLAVARAQRTKDEAGLVYAKSAVARYEKLVANHAVSQDVYDSAKSQYAQAQAQIGLDDATIELRKAELSAAQVNLDYTNIVSPVDGTVVSRSVEMGQTVAASFQTPTLFLIATDLTKMQVDTNVAESDIGQLKVGTKASFTVEAFSNRTFKGVVTQVRQSPQTVQNVVTYNAVVSADNKSGLLKPGMTATVRFETDRRDNVLRVPNQALRYVPGGLAGLPGAPSSAQNPVPSAGGQQIFVLRDGRAERIGVVTGLDDDRFTEIVKGDLKAGDRVITGEASPRKSAPRTVRSPRF